MSFDQQLGLAVDYSTVMCLLGFAASLLEAEHQVDPLVKVLGHVLTLQSRLVFLEKVAGV